MRRVKGLELDGTTVNMIIGRTQFDCLKSSYGDNLQPEKLRQMGKQTIDAITPGTYETEDGKFSVSESVWRAELAPLLDVHGFGNRIIPVIFTYTHPELGDDSDYLEARIVGLNGSNEASSKPLEREFKLIIRQIFWTDRRITINRLGDVYEALGLSSL